MKTSGTIFLNKIPLLTDPQISGISDILKTIGYIIFGAQIVPFVFVYGEPLPGALVVISAIIVLSLWITSVIMIRNIHHDI